MPLFHQLCYAHGLHLAVCDFLYKSLPFEDPGKILINSDVDPIDTSDDCEQTFNVIVEEEAEREVTDKFELSAIVKKVRASVLHFKHSPTKIDTILAKHLPSDGNNKTYSLTTSHYALEQHLFNVGTFRESSRRIASCSSGN